MPCMLSLSLVLLLILLSVLLLLLVHALFHQHTPQLAGHVSHIVSSLRSTGRASCSITVSNGDLFDARTMHAKQSQGHRCRSVEERAPYAACRLMIGRCID